MSAPVEYYVKELGAQLEGAVIEKVWLTESETITDEEAGFSFTTDSCLRLRVRYAEGTLVNDQPYGEYAVWVDSEGNGQGYLAYMGGDEREADLRRLHHADAEGRRGPTTS